MRVVSDTPGGGTLASGNVRLASELIFNLESFNGRIKVAHISERPSFEDVWTGFLQ